MDYLTSLLLFPKGGKSISRSDVETILEPMSLSHLEKLGDWLVLYFIVKNLDLLTVNQVSPTFTTLGNL